MTAGQVRRCRPMPEALGPERGIGWRVEDTPGQARTSIEGRRMMVDGVRGACESCGGAHGERLRAHELVHAAWSPTDAQIGDWGAAHGRPGLRRDDWLDGAEEIRVNALHGFLAPGSAAEPAICPKGLRGPGLMPATRVPARVARPEDEGQLLAAGRALLAGVMATGGSAEWGRWVAALRRRYSFRRAHPLGRLGLAAVETVERAVRRLQDPVTAAASDGCGCVACRRRRRQAGPAPSGPPVLTVDVASLYGPGGPNGVGWVVELADELRDLWERFKAGGLGGDLAGPSTAGEGDGSLVDLGAGTSVVWGPMRVVEGVLGVPAARPPRSLRRYDEAGTVPTAPWRLSSDGRVFAPRRRRVGGTVLVDVSGSMRWGQEQLRALVEAAPAATVAVYSGDGSAGVLHVVGRDGWVIGPGRRVNLSAHVNTVDGPALGWLGRQAGPRVWVSDGFANGVGEGPHPAVAAVLARRVGACRVVTLRGAVAALEAAARGRRFLPGDVPAAEYEVAATPWDRQAGAGLSDLPLGIRLHAGAGWVRDGEEGY